MASTPDADALAAAEAAAEAVSPPPTPEGYADPYRFEYPKLPLVIAGMIMTVVATIAYGWLLLQLQGTAVLPVVFETDAAGDVTIVLQLTQVALPLLFAFLAVAVVHELLHGVVFERYGYDVSYGIHWRFGAVYAAVFNQFHTREHNLRIGAAPLVVITAITLPLLAVPHPVVATVALFVLVLNTAGSVGDVYALYRFSRMPRGTVFYDINMEHMYVFEPE